MTENTNIKLSFGALAKPLNKQLKEQGYEFEDIDIEQKMEKYKDAINILRINRLIVNSECDKIYNRFMNKIIKNIVKLEE